MTATLVASNVFAFADGSTGHSCNMGSSPNVNEWDVLFVNSNTTVTTPTGFTPGPTAVSGQGAYIYRRKAVGGEGSTFTITTSGNHNTSVIWRRYSGMLAADDAKATTAATNGTASPAHSTNAMTTSTEICFAFAPLHNFSGASPTTPVWGASFTGVATNSQGTGSTGVVGFVAEKQPVGTAAQSPSVSWTNTALDRYMLTLTFTTATTITGTLNPASETDTAGTLGRAKVRTFGIASESDAAQTLGRVKAKPLGIAVDTSSAVALTHSRARLLGVAGETDTAGALSPAKVRVLGIASTTDAARALSKVLGLNVAVETDTARPVGASATFPPVPRAPDLSVVSGPLRVAVVSGPLRLRVVGGT